MRNSSQTKKTNFMKKLLLMSALILGIIFITGKSNAQTTQSPDKATKAQTTQTGQNTSGNFIDKNGDGVCDNFQNRGKQPNCAKFVDANGDGVCDNCKGNGNCGHVNCCGKSMQKGNCPGMNKGNCCGKGIEHQHRHGWKHSQQTTPSQPGKK